MTLGLDVASPVVMKNFAVGATTDRWLLWVVIGNGTVALATERWWVVMAVWLEMVVKLLLEFISVFAFISRSAG